MKQLLLLALAAGIFLATDATGNWTGSLTLANDNEPRPAYLVLKQDGDKLTGTAGPTATEQHPIENGRAANGNLTFELATEDSVMRFAVKQDGDVTKGDVTRERDGEKQTAKLAVERAK